MIKNFIDVIGSSGFPAGTSDDVGVPWWQVLVVLRVKQVEELCWVVASHFFRDVCLLFCASVVLSTERHSKPV